jgi:hypothetical protein
MVTGLDSDSYWTLLTASLSYLLFLWVRGACRRKNLRPRGSQVPSVWTFMWKFTSVLQVCTACLGWHYCHNCHYSSNPWHCICVDVFIPMSIVAVTEWSVTISRNWNKFLVVFCSAKFVLHIFDTNGNKAHIHIWFLFCKSTLNWNSEFFEKFIFSSTFRDLNFFPLFYFFLYFFYCLFSFSCAALTRWLVLIYLFWYFPDVN